MARYADVPNKIKMTSEAIEPTFAYMLGRWFAQAQYMKTTYGAYSDYYADALENLWGGIQLLCQLASLAEDTKHASIAASNHMREIARYIERELGFCPLNVSDVSFSQMMRKALEPATAADDEQTQETVLESLQQGLREAVTGQTIPVSELWDAINRDETFTDGAAPADAAEGAE